MRTLNRPIVTTKYTIHCSKIGSQFIELYEVEVIRIISVLPKFHSGLKTDVFGVKVNEVALFYQDVSPIRKELISVFQNRFDIAIDLELTATYLTKKLYLLVNVIAVFFLS